MTRETWQQVKEIFQAALEQPPAERDLFLSEACSGNDSLRAEVQSLIASHEKSGSFLDGAAYEVAAEVLTDTQSALNMHSGQTFNSYRILSVLGRGGMGEVYLAEDTRLGRKVALKFLPATHNYDSDRLRRFEREARAASALNHPHILTIYEIGSFDGRQFISTEYIDGETLRDRQRRSPLKLSEVLELAAQVTSALAAAHQAGIVHRDIKPENIMLRRDGYAKVVDFGLAKLTEAVESSSDTSIPTLLKLDTDTGVVMGTTAYMSPEQARGLTLDARSDIWSLGVVLYELVSGVMPFKGETPSDLIVAILERDPSPIASTSVVPSELDWIIRKALRKDREERYQTARELLSDLRSVKQQMEFTAQLERSVPADQASGSAPVEGAMGQVLRTGPGASQSTSTSEIAQQSTTGSPALAGTQPPVRTIVLIAGLGVLLVGAAIAAYKFFPRSQPASHFQSMTITRITNSGKAIDAALSPDGNYLVYALSDAGKQSLWIRQVRTANDKVIVAPAPIGFFGITFSRDGNDLYYVVKSNLDAGTLYRIPTLGGTPVKILEKIDGPVTFSPDSKQLAFVRGNFPGQGESALLIANVDGSGERVLAKRQHPEYFTPIFFTGPSWSPDGKLIAASVARVSASTKVIGFAVADGSETDLSVEPWSFAARVEWLPDMSGLLVVGGYSPGASYVWHVAYPSGEKRKITNDLNIYRAISLAADAKRFSTVQASGLVNIWIAPEGDARRAFSLSTGNVGFYGSTGNSLTWTKDGRIVFVSNESGTIDIWIMDADGENRRQLTANAGVNTSPVVSNDGKFIVFHSNRAGNTNIWRMGVDGSNPVRLTSGLADRLPAVTPDDKWIFYTAGVSGKPTLWKVSADGGEPIQVSDVVAVAPSISPDGKFVAYLFPESSDPLAPPNRIGVMPINGGEPKAFPFQPSGTIAPFAQWSLDGRSILYTVNNNNVTNIWSQPLDGGPPKQVTDFKDSLMTGFAWSRDGKTLASTRGTLWRDAVLITEAR
jgi:eukaryotic-like serine/threonine-protein kinase